MNINIYENMTPQKIPIKSALVCFLEVKYILM